ncbi:MAG: hypothetical protein ACRDV2_07630, partial [Actinomycetes bacterium]
HSRRAAAPAPPEVLRFQHEIRARVRSAPPTAEALAAQVSDALSESTDRHGDWRWGLDALRPLTQDLWARLPTAEKAELLATTGAWWDVHRHRMAPDAAAAVGRMRTAGRL